MSNASEESKDYLTTKCVSAIKDFVNTVRPTRYSTDGLPGYELLDAEAKLNKSWSDFDNLSEYGWLILREKISRADEMYLWYYAVRMAEMAVRKNDVSFIHFSLMALIVDDRFMEQRDVFTALALLLDAAKRIGADSKSIFARVAKLGTPKRSETIVKYVDDRGGEASMEQVLKGLGYAASGSGETFTYRSSI